jgi:two-component system, NarL family, sensor kinase
MKARHRGPLFPSRLAADGVGGLKLRPWSRLHHQAWAYGDRKLLPYPKSYSPSVEGIAHSRTAVQSRRGNLPSLQLSTGIFSRSSVVFACLLLAILCASPAPAKEFGALSTTLLAHTQDEQNRRFNTQQAIPRFLLGGEASGLRRERRALHCPGRQVVATPSDRSAPGGADLFTSAHYVRLAGPPPFWTMERLTPLLMLISWVLGPLAWLAFLRRRVREQIGRFREWLRREAALKEHYRDLLENANDIVFTCNLDGGFTSLNKSGEGITGYTRQEALHLNLAEVITPEQRPRFAEALSRLRSGEVSPIREYEVIAKDGRRLSLEVSQRLLVEAGKPVGIQGIARDVTARKRAEREIQERTAILNSLIQNCPLGIVVTDSEGRVKLCNPAFERLFLYHQAEVLGANLGELIGAQETRIEMAARDRLFSGGEPVQFTSQRRQKNGKVLDVEVHKVPVMESGKVATALHFYQDTTQRRQAEKAMGQLSGRLLKLQDEERRHLARELHDTTVQALTALVLNLTALETSAPTLDAKSCNRLSDSLALAEQCAREVRTLSYLLHPPLLDEVGLGAAVRHYVEGFAQRSGLQVALDLPCELGRLPGDAETALFRVVQESLTNIHRHSGSRQARVRLACPASEVRLEVEDGGKGIPPEIREDTNGTASGLGVGILGMRERLRQLGGQLEIHSNGHGTTVRAVLPLPGGNYESSSHTGRG